MVLWIGSCPCSTALGSRCRWLLYAPVGRRAPAKLNGDGPRRPALTDYVIALTGNEPFTCATLVDTLRPYLKLKTDRIAAAHRIHVAVNRDPRFCRHEHGIYTRIHHDPDPEGQPGH